MERKQPSAMQARLLKHLRGELDPARAREIEELMAADPEVRAEFELMERTWLGLDNPAPPAAPPDFAAGVFAALEPRAPAAWPAAVRWAAAGVATAGVTLGAAFGSWVLADDAGDLLYARPSLAESYVDLLEEEGR